MVNLFPDIVQHDTPAGRKASYVYIVLLTCSMLAAILFYSVSVSTLVKTASSSDDYFGLEMYAGTTDCSAWHSCLYQKSTSAKPTVTGLRCDCQEGAGKLIAMTQYPLAPAVTQPSDWCASAASLQQYAGTLPPIITATTATTESSNAFNFFSSTASCAGVATATSSSGSAYAVLPSGTVLEHIVAWRSLGDASIGVANYLRLSPGTTPTAESAGLWLIMDAYLSVDPTSAQAASDAAKAASGLQNTAKGATSVTLQNSCNGAVGVGGVTAGTGLYWPLVIQINSRCQDKMKEVDKFQLTMESTYIISSTLMNNKSYTEFHTANRKLIGSNTFTVAPLPVGQTQTPNQTPEDPALKYARLGVNDYLQGLDNIQLFYPSYSNGYALAYAEYTQTFVLQYLGDLLGASSTEQYACTGTVSLTSGPSPNTACQLTFTQTLKSVFPLTDAHNMANLNKDTGNMCNKSALQSTPARSLIMQMRQADFARLPSIQLEQGPQAQHLTKLYL